MKALSRTFCFQLVMSSALLPASAPAAQTGSIVSVGPCHTPTTCEPPPPNSGFTAVASGNYHVMGLKEDGSVVTWGLCDVEQCGAPANNRGFVDIDAGDSHSLAMRADGSIVAWGQNDNGELNVPEPNIGYVAMAAGGLHNLALRADGSIVGWGYTARGVLDIPQPNTGWVKIAASSFKSMGLKADGTIYRWGDCGAVTVPCDVIPADPRFIDIATHHSHALALRSDGSILAWGDNSFGQLNVPEPNTGFVKIAAGGGFSLGLKADGRLLAWGYINTVPSPNAGYFDMDANQGPAEAVRASTTSGCQSNADCNDGLFCNGTESCVNGACQAGTTPACASPLLCRESDDQCVSCLSNSQCDDGLFCNGSETCNASGRCQAGNPVCPAGTCSESTNMCMSGTEVWVSFTDDAAVPGLGTVAPQDIVAYTVASGTWSTIFDGSDVGLSGLVIDGLARLTDGSLLLSFTEPANIPGMTGGPSGTSLDDSDIVRFVPTTLGAATAGSFAFYFDGSDVGLTQDNEDIDAITLTNGQLAISTVGSVKANGANGADSDLLLFNATSLGAGTAGSFSVRFDGSDVGLSDGTEDVDAAAVTASGALLFSTISASTVPGASAADHDILRFNPSTLGASTTGTWSIYLDLAALGIDASENVGGVELVP